ncbi:hypothetical protein ACFPK1_22625 [Actinomycetospora rhizophila]|uniref:Integral membrane protein n=1 Tax=Actinomycetospora rhizophila TaxID=1416876 RepID=A0ABV9ZHL3_9PSEU
MRSALLLLGGLVLLGAGIAVIALGVPGGWVFGPGLIVAGLLVKVAGFLLTDDAPGTPPGGSGRTVTTLGPAAERTRGATAAGRTSALRRARTARTARATEAARAAALSPVTGRRGPGRRAS